MLQTLFDYVYEDGKPLPSCDDSEHDLEDRLRVHPLRTPAAIDYNRNSVDREESTMLMDVYENLLDLWMSGISHAVPSRARVKLEKEIRKAAVQIYLASHGLQRGPSMCQELDTNSSTRDMSGRRHDLPLRRKASIGAPTGKGKEILKDKFFPHLSEPLSTSTTPQQSQNMLPTPEATPSLHSQPSMSSHTAEMDLSYDRLKRLTSLETPPSLSESMSKLVSHWQVGQNPEAYDWNKTHRALSSLDEKDGVENAFMSKLQRRMTKKRQRQNSQALASQTIPSRVFGSQSAVVASSSQSVQAFMTQSQPEAGSKGARPGTFKKKKLIRKSGF